ncbi:hypothetical protein CAPTEDRAFT_185282 [Capitella teleta]|uniref:Uncharacterized protein n=1 Tax=Capitella teleta TaxID=283909 RepID=R7T5E3_CAPTE|nr:hypothetical protein CAPTEDRAFT_185282 [Capitella teleta]|eukprot:ELT88338.1 hypothetical protein CAPTEDRAFT_185282 [Capitella teleta]
MPGYSVRLLFAAIDVTSCSGMLSSVVCGRNQSSDASSGLSSAHPSRAPTNKRRTENDFFDVCFRVWFLCDCYRKAQIKRRRGRSRRQKGEVKGDLFAAAPDHAIATLLATDQVYTASL